MPNWEKLSNDLMRGINRQMRDSLHQMSKSKELPEEKRERARQLEAELREIQKERDKE